MLGWSPSVPLREGLLETIDHFHAVLGTGVARLRPPSSPWLQHQPRLEGAVIAEALERKQAIRSRTRWFDVGSWHISAVPAIAVAGQL